MNNENISFAQVRAMLDKQLKESLKEAKEAAEKSRMECYSFNSTWEQMGRDHPDALSAQKELDAKLRLLIPRAKTAFSSSLRPDYRRSYYMYPTPPAELYDAEGCGKLTKLRQTPRIHVSADRYYTRHDAGCGGSKQVEVLAVPVDVSFAFTGETKKLLLAWKLAGETYERLNKKAGLVNSALENIDREAQLLLLKLQSPEQFVELEKAIADYVAAL